MEEKKFYPDFEYNKSKRIKFFVLLGLLFVCVGVVIGVFIGMGQWYFSLFMGIILALMVSLIPSVIKSYPMKRDTPSLVVNDKTIIISGKEYKLAEIEAAVVTVMLPPVSKLDSENKAFLSEYAGKMPEEECFGTVDISMKPSPKVKKGETKFLTVKDCMGALLALSAAGLKHYKIFFTLKKYNEPARFSITKEDKKKSALSDTTPKSRMKQLM